MHPMLLVLSPLGKWGIVVAELRFVASTGQYLERGKRVREELLDEDASQELRQLVALSEALPVPKVSTRMLTGWATPMA